MKRCLVVAAFLAGCIQPVSNPGINPFGDLAAIVPGGDGGGAMDGAGNVGADMVTPPKRQSVDLSAKTKIDLLVMVDNSNSMEAMAQELRARFPQLIKPLQDLAGKGAFADLNLGVVTSDYGAGAVGAPGCTPSPGGQRGKLQARGVAAPNGCLAPIGANFVHYIFGPNGPTMSNLPQNQDLSQTFTCMASVGASGCGFEHQLESVYAALHDNIPENTGFLRADALLAVLFLTNEDDSSAPPTTDMFDKSLTAQYGFEDSYRQTRWGVMCGMPAMLPPYSDSGGQLANCVPATNPPGKEYDVHRYSDFFSRSAGQGGVKENPLDVLLFAIDAPEKPFSVILSNPGTQAGQPYVECGQLNESTNPPCVPVLQHSCQNQVSPQFFGDPAVRLNTVVRSVPSHGIASICDGDFSQTLSNLGNVIGARFGGGCVTFKLPEANGKPAPDCLVEDVTHNMDNTTTRKALPQCGNNVFPCWRLDPKPECAQGSPQGVGIVIDRNGQPRPPATTTEAACVPG